MQKYLLIALGGAIGSIARYSLGTTIANRMGTKTPYGTFVINILACTLIGFSATLLTRRTGLNPAWRFLVPIGFVGAFSTFSTFEWENFSIIRRGTYIFAVLYALGSLLLGFVAVWCGSAVADFMQ